MLKLVSLSVLVLSLAGCLVAIDAIVPESDAIFDPHWVGGDGASSVVLGTDLRHQHIRVRGKFL